MGDTDPSSSSSSGALSARARKRQRQKVNQQKRTLDHDALGTFRKHPTLANAFRAWLAQIQDSVLPQEHYSAVKFARSLRAFSDGGTGQPDTEDIQNISADFLVEKVEDLAWSLNVNVTLRDDAGRLKTATSRIGPNFRSFILFLTRENVLQQSDVTYLLEACDSLEDDLDRTARVNRIMEEYISHIQDAYYDVCCTVDQSFWGEYEIGKISGRRLLVLRRYGAAEDGEEDVTTRVYFSTRFPMPLTDIIKIGDILTLQLCYLGGQDIWVPYMYSGFTPMREDGEETPRDTRGKVTQTPAAPDAGFGVEYITDDERIATLQRELAKVELLSAQRQQHVARRRDSEHGSKEDDRLRDDTFDEARFTEEYFQSWEGDIDSDDDIGDMVDNDDQSEFLYSIN